MSSETVHKVPKELLALWRNNEEYRRLTQTIGGGLGPCSIQGVPEAAALHLAAALLDELDRMAVFVAHGEEEAMRLAEELALLVSGVHYLPPREIQLGAFFAAGREIAAKRLAVLEAVYEGKARAIVCSGEALMQVMAPPDVIRGASIALAVGDVLPPQRLIEALARADYERVEKVDGAGQFRAAGDIIDVFVPGKDLPYRIEFFDEDVDSIRSFDPANQRSVDKVERVQIPPSNEAPLTDAARKRGITAFKKEIKRAAGTMGARLDALIDALNDRKAIEGAEQLLPYFYEGCTLIGHLPEDAIVCVFETRRVEEAIVETHAQFAERLAQGLETGGSLPRQGALLIEPGAFWASLTRGTTISVSAFARQEKEIAPKALFHFALRSAPQFGARLDILAGDLRGVRGKTTVLFFAGKRAEHLRISLSDLDFDVAVAKELARPPVPGEMLIVETPLARGYEAPDRKLLVLGEHDIFGSRKRPVKVKRAKGASKLDIFADLKVGDFVVHESHGIGIFKGIETRTSQGVSRDFLVIQYAGSDKVGVSTDELDRVQKYVGNADRAPRLSKLGGADWKRTVNKVRESVKELAFDLVALYASRQARQGYAFSEDTIWQKQLEDAFPYEETEGQLQSIAEIKKDMESPHVMERLLCGDVGYGKTEVALRAAFKAAQDGKQVAVLVPTTILAQQHYQTFVKRFEGFPLNVGLLSRLRTAKQQRETLKTLKEGLLDVAIGTHRLLGKDVEFRDLGLLIVDEEQRFGVGHKEQIKNLKKDIDVLSLSATPIPRTLHMSMVGIRDMSVIETPPEERYPVQTYVMEYSDALAREAILKEIGHKGQVYFLYNNVAGMERMLGQLREAVPEATFRMAHGQMPQGQLEKTMLEFMAGEFDVLLCSTIIESGLDIPNVNTIIVYDADHYGLSQLYQLRGRVGRSSRMAYAFLTLRPDKSLSEVAEKRLRSIREFTEFGSGFKIAMRDLEIRGAGNLLGAQQHGHMDEVGYDYYCKLVEEAVQEVRGETPAAEIETQIDIPIDAHIPKFYIRDAAQRLEIYKRIATIRNRQDYYDVQEELEDRFGNIPESVDRLLDVALLKARANAVGLTQVVMRPEEFRLRFSPQSPFDGEPLIRLLQEEKFCKLLPGEQAILQYREKDAGFSRLIAQCDGIVQKMFICICGEARL